ncbi:MAG TPA: methyltransferase domain-containing protein [Clostridia bacterium]|nr:methyltransferase domain-containing protein [Clostridia bacterium]
MSRIDIKESIDIFLCPICGKKMKAYGSGRITCKNKHSFDLSRNGYVNLLLSPAKLDYDKNMLKSRSLICRSNFFRPMIDQLSTLILKEKQKENTDMLKILDAGCGEGSHLAQITASISSNSSIKAKSFGIDISKDGIQLASRDYPEIVWCVADLARLPFTGKRFDVILSILSPSNYKEFNRVISHDGILVKVIPGNSYLKELRILFYDRTDKETYSNDRVIEHFKSNFNIFNIQQLQYNMPIDKGNLVHLVKMTPLSWRAPSEKIENILSSGIDNITVDLSIIAGSKKKYQ